MVDFRTVKEAATAEKVVAFLALDLKKNGDAFRGKCPICKHNDPRAFVLTPSKGAFYCFKHKKGGDMLALVSEAKGIPIKEAAEQLAAALGIEAKTESAPAQKKPFDAEKYIAGLDPAHEALASLDVSPETFRAWKGGYSTSGINKGRLALPLEASDGIKGFMGISLKDRSIIAPKDCDPRLYLFGGYHLVEGDVYLMHDPIDVLQATERGIPNCVCFLSEKISVEQLFYLSKFFEDRGLENIVLTRGHRGSVWGLFFMERTMSSWKKYFYKCYNCGYTFSQSMPPKNTFLGILSGSTGKRCPKCRRMCYPSN